MKRTLLVHGRNPETGRPAICEVSVPGTTQDSILTASEIRRGRILFGITNEGRKRLPEVIAAANAVKGFLKANAKQLQHLEYKSVEELDAYRVERIKGLLKADGRGMQLIYDGEEADIYSVGKGMVVKHNDGRIARVEWRNPNGNGTAWERVRRMEALRLGHLHRKLGVPKQYGYVIVDYPDGHQESLTIMQEVPGKRVSWVRDQQGENTLAGLMTKRKFLHFIHEVMKAGEQKIVHDPRSSHNHRLFTDPVYEGNTLIDGRKYWLLDQ